MLPWVLRPKKYYHLEIYSLPFKGSTVFLLAFRHNYCPLGRALYLPYSSAFLACKYNSFIPVDWPKSVMRNTIDPLKARG